MVEKNWAAALQRLAVLAGSLVFSANAFAFIANVATETELNNAITAYNTQVTGDHTINIVNSFTLTGATTPINQSSPGVDLDIVGNGQTIDGANSHRILTILDAARITISNLTFQNGRATRGGAIEIGSAIVSISSSNFLSNTSTETDGVNVGGGGAIFSAGPSTSIFGSYFTGNSSAKVGGAIAVWSGSTFINQTTIYDNSVPNVSGSFAGGVYLRGGSNVEIIGSTIYANRIGGNLNDHPLQGENVMNNGGNLDISSTIIFNGSCRPGVGSTTAQYSMFSGVTNASCNFSHNDVNHNQVNVDPLLTTPGDFGGPTLTLALPPNSPAIDRGFQIFLQNTVDQRNQNRESGTLADVGAFEYLKPDAEEVNDTMMEATEITGSTTLIGLNIDDEQRDGTVDQDFFKFFLPADKPFDVTVSFFHQQGDIDIILEDANGLGLAGGFSTTNNEVLSFTPAEAGEYFLSVYGFSNDRNNYTIEFQIPEEDELCLPIPAANNTYAVICL